VLSVMCDGDQNPASLYAGRAWCRGRDGGADDAILVMFRVTIRLAIWPVGSSR
jgi:hypothetical protein